MTQTIEIRSARCESRRPGFSPNGCYIGTAIEQEAVFWLAEETGDYGPADAISEAGAAFDRALRETDFDDEAADRLDAANAQLQAAFKRAARWAVN